MLKHTIIYCVFDVRKSNVCFIGKVANFLCNKIMLIFFYMIKPHLVMM